jgi:hypothetical protein
MVEYAAASRMEAVVAEDWTCCLVTDRIVPPPFRGVPYLFWFLCFAAFAGAAWAISSGMPQRWSYFLFCLSIAAGFLTVPLAFRLAYFRFKSWSENVPSFVVLNEKFGADALAGFLSTELSQFRGPASAFILSVPFGVMASFIFWIAGYPVGLGSVSSIFAGALVACSAFIAGLGLVTIFYGCRTIWRLGAFGVRVRSNKFEITSTGAMLAQCYLAIAFSWALYSSSAIAWVDGKHLADAQLPLMLLSAPTFVAFSASFIACQFPLHLRMLEFKRRELRTIEDQLDQLKPTRAEDLDSARKEKINYFETKRNEAAALPEWPFNSRALWGVLVSSVTAVFPALVTTSLSTVAKAAGFLH